MRYSLAVIADILRSGNRSPLHVYYGLDVNTPFFKLSYAESKSSLVVDLSPYSRVWLDPRPGTPVDLARLAEAAERRAPGAAKLLVDRASRGLLMASGGGGVAADNLLQLWVDGAPYALIWLDPSTLTWDMLPLEGAARLLLREGVDSGPGWRIVGSKLIVDADGVERCVELSGDWLWGGLGDAWDSTPRSDWRRVYEANLDYIEWLIDRSRRAVEWLEGRLGRRGLLAVSGGKDSLLAAHILHEVGSNYEAVVTVMEHGEPREAKEVALEALARLGRRVHIIEWRWSEMEAMVRGFGVPVRGWRWCTWAWKLSPQLRLARRLFGVSGVVSYTGSRMFETEKRSRKPPTYIDAGTGVLSHSVPYKWPRLLVYLALWYRYKQRLPRDYQYGMERVSCVTCPYKNLAELLASTTLYPEDYEAWRPHLERTSRAAGDPWEAVMRVHGWRLILSRDSSLLAVAAGYKPRPPRLPPAEPPRRGVAPSEVEVWARKLSATHGAEKAALLGMLEWCTSCGICEAACPREAIRLANGRPVLLESRCDGCRVCLYTCPQALRAAYLYVRRRRGWRAALEWISRARERASRVRLEEALRAEEELARRGPR